MTPCRCPRWRRPVGRIPDSTRLCESIELKPCSRRVFMTPGCCQTGSVMGPDYSGNTGPDGTEKAGSKGSVLPKWRGVALALPEHLRCPLFQVDDGRGLAAAEAGIDDQVDVMR